MYTFASNVNRHFFVGNTGNNLVELANMIWLASVLNSTLMIPQYMTKFLGEFNLSILNEVYCVRSMPSDAVFLSEKDLKQILPIGSKNHKIYNIESEMSFFAIQLFRNHELSHLLPKYDKKLIKVLSRHYLKVYSALWSSPAKYIISSTNYIISNFLGGNFAFSSVHKRSFEGACSRLLSASLLPSDFSAIELPMDNKEWSEDLTVKFPLCEMNGSFVADTLKLNHRQDNKLFVSFDGQGSASTLEALGAVFSSVLDSSKEYSHFERKYVDMHVAVHGAFFLLNPMSTFSLQVFVIRSSLGLDSVPIMTNNDLYCQSRKHFESGARDGLWVSLESISDAAKDIRESLNISN